MSTDYIIGNGLIFYSKYFRNRKLAKQNAGLASSNEKTQRDTALEIFNSLQNNPETCIATVRQVEAALALLGNEVTDEQLQKAYTANPVLRSRLVSRLKPESDSNRFESFKDPSSNELTTLSGRGEERITDFLQGNDAQSAYEKLIRYPNVYNSFSAEELLNIALQNYGVAVVVFNQPASRSKIGDIAKLITPDNIKLLLDKKPDETDERWKHYFPIVFAFLLKNCPEQFKQFWQNQNNRTYIQDVLFNVSLENKRPDVVNQINQNPHAFLLLADHNADSLNVLALVKLLLNANDPIELLKQLISHDRNGDFSNALRKNIVNFVATFKAQFKKLKAELENESEELKEFKSTIKTTLKQLLEIKLQSDETIKKAIETYVSDNIKLFSRDIESDDAEKLSNAHSSLVKITPVVSDAFFSEEISLSKEDQTNLSAAISKYTITLVREVSNNDNHDSKLLFLAKTPNLCRDITVFANKSEDNLRSGLAKINTFLASHIDIKITNTKFVGHFFETYTKHYSKNVDTGLYVKNADRSAESQPNLSYETAFLIKSDTKLYARFKRKPNLLDALLYNIFGFVTDNQKKINNNKKSRTLIKQVIRQGQEEIETLKQEFSDLKAKQTVSEKALDELIDQAKTLLEKADGLNDERINQKINEVIKVTATLKADLAKDHASMELSELREYKIFCDSVLAKLDNTKLRLTELETQVDTGLLKQVFSALKAQQAVSEKALDELTAQAETLLEKASGLNDKVINQEISKVIEVVAALKTDLTKDHTSMELSELRKYKIFCDSVLATLDNAKQTLLGLENQIDTKLLKQSISLQKNKLNSSLSDLKRELTELQTKARPLNIEDLNNDILTQINQLNAFKALLEKDHAEMNLMMLVEFKNDTCERIENIIKPFKQNIESLEKQILLKIIEDAKNNVAFSQANIDALKRKFEDINFSVSLLKNATISRKFSDLKSDFETLQADLNKNQILMNLSDLQGYECLCGFILERLNTLKNDLNGLETEINELNRPKSTLAPVAAPSMPKSVLGTAQSDNKPTSTLATPTKTTLASSTLAQPVPATVVVTSTLATPTNSKLATPRSTLGQAAPKSVATATLAVPQKSTLASSTLAQPEPATGATSTLAAAPKSTLAMPTSTLGQPAAATSTSSSMAEPSQEKAKPAATLGQTAPKSAPTSTLAAAPKSTLAMPTSTLAQPASATSTSSSMAGVSQEKAKPAATLGQATSSGSSMFVGDPLKTEAAAIKFLRENTSESNYAKYAEVAFKWCESLLNYVDKEYLAIAAKTSADAANYVMTNQKLSALLTAKQIFDIYFAHQKNLDFIKMVPKFIPNVYLPVIMEKIVQKPDLNKDTALGRIYTNQTFILNSYNSYSNRPLSQLSGQLRDTVKSFREKGINPHELLGIALDADETAIKNAYKTKVRELHPDRNPDNLYASEQFNMLQQAKAIMDDSQARACFRPK